MSDWQWINQLVMKWTLFTRNTIGWSITWASWEYLFPGWQTWSRDQVKIYDLNYIRLSNENLATTYNNWNEDNFVIIYNPQIQTNPPAGFGN